MEKKENLKAERKRQQNNFSIRTDLAIEAKELIESDADTDESEIEGVKVTIEEICAENITVTWVEIFNEQGAKHMGKPMGNYVTIESDAMKENDRETHEEIIKVLSKRLIKLRKLEENSVILVVGLGNWNVTPDALGPRVVSKILVTRHIKEQVPELIDESVRPVCAIAPGVMGITGIETSEIVKGVVDKIHPDLVIAIDALAARRTNRINTTIQMSDTGVNPGAGMGNKRTALNEETLGVPVIAIGVPTVVDAATLVNDTMDCILDSMIQAVDKGTAFYETLSSLDKDEKYAMITEILNPYVGNMFVTPKEVDSVIERLANMIANAVNIALHPGVDLEDVNKYIL